MPAHRAMVLAAATALLLLAADGGRRWAKYEPEMQDPWPDPPGAWDNTEFAWGRLRYRSNRDAGRGGGFYRGWGGRARWGVDANKSDRQFLIALRRLTRIDARSVEHILDIDSDELFDYPYLYAVGVGDWVFTPAQAARLRSYFERGGFLVVDDFHNEREWAQFMAGIELVLPGLEVVELDDRDPIYNTVYSIQNRFRVPGLNVVHGDQIERGGIEPHWRGVIDAKGRVVVAILFNQDFGDAWEWADLPDYPEKYATLAFKIGVNYVMYSMTH